MDIYTAQYRYAGTDRLDITVKGQDPIGKLFAPTWPMVMGLKNGSMTEEQYTQMYHRKLNDLFTTSLWQDLINPLWQDLIKVGRVTLVCFCPPNAFCHRVLLAQYLQGMNWGVYRAELKL